MVTLPYSNYKEIVSEIIRWGVVLRGLTRQIRETT
jgi:hypothetical protein